MNWKTGLIVVLVLLGAGLAWYLYQKRTAPAKPKDWLASLGSSVSSFLGGGIELETDDWSLSFGRN